MPAALEADRVDAIWAPEPFLTSVLGKGGREIEAPLTTLGPRYPNGTYSATEKQLAEDEEVVAAFTRAINKSMEYATAQPGGGAGDDPDVHADPAGGGREDPPAAVAGADRDRQGRGARPATP